MERPSATVVRAFAADLVTRRILVKSVPSRLVSPRRLGSLCWGFTREEMERRKREKKEGKKEDCCVFHTKPFFVIEYSGLL